MQGQFLQTILINSGAKILLNVYLTKIAAVFLLGIFSQGTAYQAPLFQYIYPLVAILFPLK